MDTFLRPNAWIKLLITKNIKISLLAKILNQYGWGISQLATILHLCGCNVIQLHFIIISLMLASLATPSFYYGSSVS